MFWETFKVILCLAAATLVTFFVFGFFGGFIEIIFRLALHPFNIIIPGFKEIISDSIWAGRIMFAFVYLPIITSLLWLFVDFGMFGSRSPFTPK